MTCYDHTNDPDVKPGMFETYGECLAAIALAGIGLLLVANFIAWALHGFNFPGAQ